MDVLSDIKIKNKKFLKYSYFTVEHIEKTNNVRSFILSRIFLVRAIIIICTMLCLYDQYNISNNNENCNTQVQKKTKLVQFLFSRSEHFSWVYWSSLTGNFFARYINENVKYKGVRVFHLNIRKLQNKVSEIKNVMKELSPHMFSVSECEIRKNSPNFSLEKLKVPGYNIHFPKSWDLHGYARVILYYKKTFNCPRVPELEDEHLQSIWVKFGFKNIKASSVDFKGSSGPHFLELRHRQSVLFWVLAYISEGTHARWLVCTKALRRNF